MSLLSPLSKILERLPRQLQSFISQSNPAILSLNNSPIIAAIPVKISLVRASTISTGRWMQGTRLELYCWTCAKVIDCTSRELLLLELQSCGTGGMPLAWFSSYLYGWVACVETSHTPGGEEFVATCDVPQVSVFRPPLFAIYTWALLVLRQSLLSLYAEDVT